MSLSAPKSGQLAQLPLLLEDSKRKDEIRSVNRKMKSESVNRKMKSESVNRKISSFLLESSSNNGNWANWPLLGPLRLI